jgi:flagellar biosynthesis/type III secretory pathway protein FliH
MPGRGRILSSQDAARALPLRFGAVAAAIPAPLESNECLEVQRLRLELERTQWLEQQRASLLELGRALAERLLGEALRLDRAVIVELAREVLREAAGARQVCLHCSPFDYEQLIAAKPLFGEAFQLSLEVVVDASLAAGDLLLESELGRTDARLKTRLDYLLEILRQGAHP